MTDAPQSPRVLERHRGLVPADRRELRDRIGDDRAAEIDWALRRRERTVLDERHDEDDEAEA